MIKLKKEIISLDEWLDIDDCPIQRDTEEHAASASLRHLKETSPTHMNVAAARLETGEVYKLDGHTRAHLWATGKLEPPAQILYVDMYYCENMQQVEDLYQQFDNAQAAEHLRDKLYGAYRLHGFKPSSQLITRGGVASALSTILGVQFSKHSIYNAVTPFMQAIKLIDKEDLAPRPFPSHILATAIVTIHKDGDKAMPFWRTYANDEGVKDGKYRDGVQALTELVTSLRTSTGGAMSHSKRMGIAGRALSAYLGYQKGYKYSVRLKTTDFAKYVIETAQITRGAKAA